MIRLLSIGLASASLLLASCATKKSDCSACDAAGSQKAAAECCSKGKSDCCDSSKKGHKH